MIIISKVGRRDQVTLPRAIQHQLNLQERDRVAFIGKGSDVPAQADAFEALLRRAAGGEIILVLHQDDSDVRFRASTGA